MIVEKKDQTNKTEKITAPEDIDIDIFTTNPETKFAIGLLHNPNYKKIRS